MCLYWRMLAGIASELRLMYFQNEFLIRHSLSLRAVQFISYISYSEWPEALLIDATENCTSF